MLECTEAELPEVLDFLRKDIPNCFYMYVDISKYGLSPPELSVWTLRDTNGVTAVVMKYFGNMQVYAHPEAELSPIAKLIIKENAPIVTGTAEICDELNKLMPDRYAVSHGWTFEIEKFRNFSSPLPICIASDDDLIASAKLICEDENLGSHCDYENLLRQLRERRDDGMGRNYVIHKDGEVIGHIATYAEYEDYAVTSGLIVHPEYRDQPYGTYLESYLMNKLLEEGKRVFTFLRLEKRMKYYRALGQKKFWHNGKMIRNSGD